MSRTKFAVGIDLSKDWFDYALVDSTGKLILSARYKNNGSGQAKMVKAVRKHTDGSIEHVLFCCEHTGIYGKPLQQYAAIHADMQLWICHPADLKKCMGVVRGKSDSIDAQRIAQYAIRYQDKARIWKAMPSELKGLQELCRLRERILKSIHMLSVPVKEAKKMDPEAGSVLAKHSKPTISVLKKNLEEVEREIEIRIGQSPEVSKNYKLLTSIKGLGMQTALGMILITRNFTIMTNARKLACYAGVAPFEYSSGTSVKARKRVSQQANKNIKTLLQMAAVSAIKCDIGIKNYYIRKLAEGKNKMSVINAVRFKLISRMVAVQKRGTPYIPEENLVEVA